MNEEHRLEVIEEESEVATEEDMQDKTRAPFLALSLYAQVLPRTASKRASSEAPEARIASTKLLKRAFSVDPKA